MNFKQSVILLEISSLFAIIVATEEVLPKKESNTKLLDVMARSNDFLRNTSSRSKRCFQKYQPIIDEIIEEYEINYWACENTSGEEQLKAENATLGKRNDLLSSGNKSCYMLSQCNKMETPELVLDCYVVAGLEAIKVMNDIENSALKGLSDLREKVRVAKNVENKCLNDTQKKHDEQSVKTYEELNECIDKKPTTESPNDAKESEGITSSTKSSAIIEPVQEPQAPKNPESSSKTSAESKPFKNTSEAPEKLKSSFNKIVN